MFLLKSGKSEDAYKYGLSLIPNNDPEILKMMGYLCIGLNKYDEALQYLGILKEENFLKGIAYYEKG